MKVDGEVSRVQSLPTACRLVLATALLLTAAAAAPGPVSGQESERHETTSEHHEAAGEHRGTHHHKNHVAFFVGSTEAEEHHGEKGDRDFTIGIDYERRLSQVFGIGLLADWVIEGNREYMLGIPLFLHVGRHAKFQLAPAFHHLTHSGENEFVLRTGFLWDFDVGNMTLSPGVWYDFTEGQDFFVFGLGVGKGF